MSVPLGLSTPLFFASLCTVVESTPMKHVAPLARLVLPALILGLLAISNSTVNAQDAPPQAIELPPGVQVESDTPAEEGPAAQTEGATESEEAGDWMTKVDRFFGKRLLKPLAAVLFFDFWSTRWIRAYVPEEVACPNDQCKHNQEKLVTRELFPGGSVPIVIKCPQCATEIETGTSVPLVVLWLFIGAVFFTVKMGFINIRGFWHAIRVTKGDYDDPADEGEVSHFQALASALSATVGLGNIAGVAIAVGLGGPGAIFWLILAGILGMSTKFAECTLGQLYRKVDRDGTVSGGPMHYLRDGLTELGLPRLGIFLATVFAVVCMGGSFGGGCVFQISQSLEALQEQIPVLEECPWIYGVVMMVLVGIVIIGGIRRIAATAEKIVPLMCGIYVLAALYILAVNYWMILPAFALIFKSAFTANAAYGGFLGVMVIGIKRAAFSNEAGLGSASIAHAAAKTDEPVSEGIVALLEPFIDTVIVCTMTGLVIVITSVYSDPQYADLIAGDKGAPLTSAAFASVISWFPYVLSVAVCLFAYSTLISWSYYGERCWSHLFGRRSALAYKIIFLGFVFLGSIVSATHLKDFSDLMILSMAFPNILGVALLSGKIRRALDDYWGRLKAGELDRNHS